MFATTAWWEAEVTSETPSNDDISGTDVKFGNSEDSEASSIGCSGVPDDSERSANNVVDSGTELEEFKLYDCK